MVAVVGMMMMIIMIIYILFPHSFSYVLLNAIGATTQDGNICLPTDKVPLHICPKGVQFSQLGHHVLRKKNALKCLFCCFFLLKKKTTKKKILGVKVRKF